MIQCSVEICFNSNIEVKATRVSYDHKYLLKNIFKIPALASYERNWDGNDSRDAIDKWDVNFNRSIRDKTDTSDESRETLVHEDRCLR